MRLRRDERAALIKALEAEYESAEAAADSVYNLVLELLQQRDAHAVGIKAGPSLVLGYGPFWNMNDVKKFTKAVGLPAQPVLLGSPAPIWKREAEWAEDARYCSGCEHPKFAHYSHGKFSGCSVSKCKCKEVYK